MTDPRITNHGRMAHGLHVIDIKWPMGWPDAMLTTTIRAKTNQAAEQMATSELLTRFSKKISVDLGKERSKLALHRAREKRAQRACVDD